MPYIRKQREKQGISIRTAAKVANVKGLNYSVLSLIERGETVLASKEVLARLKEMFLCDVKDLYSREELYSIPPSKSYDRCRMEFPTAKSTVYQLQDNQLQRAGFTSRRELLAIVARMVTLGILTKSKALLKIRRKEKVNHELQDMCVLRNAPRLWRNMRL